MKPLLIVLVALVAGCTGGESNPPVSRKAAAPVSRGANGDCVRAWNAAGNGVNRLAAATKHIGWSVDFSEWRVSHPNTDPSGSELIGEGCSYFFHSSTRWQSYSGGWEADGDLRWDVPSTMGGKRTPEQQIQPPNAILRADGKLARRAPDDGGPVNDREWKAVIDDWYDNGEWDEPHRCGAVRAAIGRIPVDGRDLLTVREDLLAYIDQVC